MCLFIRLYASAAARQRLQRASVAMDSSPLRLQVSHLPRWSWATSDDVRAEISEEGGCACSLLADDAEWDTDYWALRRETLEPLASLLETVVNAGVSQFVFEALWDGDEPEYVERVSLGGLLAFVRAGQVGARARYIVQASA